jgi:hypothetical protein
MPSSQTRSGGDVVGRAELQVNRRAQAELPFFHVAAQGFELPASSSSGPSPSAVAREFRSTREFLLRWRFLLFEQPVADVAVVDRDELVEPERAAGLGMGAGTVPQQREARRLTSRQRRFIRRRISGSR